MKKYSKKPQIQQITALLNRGTPIALSDVSRYIKNIRNSIGMTQKQMAKKIGISAPTLNKIEKNIESSSLNTISKIANVLNLEVMVSFLSREPLKVLVKRQAEKKAKKIINHAYSTMSMEEQAPSKKTYAQKLKELIEEFNNNPDSSLWED